MNTTSLKWDRLKSMKCPKCNATLDQDKGTRVYLCTNKNCTFSITTEVFETMINQLYKNNTPRLYQPKDNAEELNNL